MRCGYLVEEVTIQEFGVIDCEIEVSKEGTAPDRCYQRGN